MRGPARPWLMWSIGAAGFAYAYFHRVAPSVMVSELMRDLAVGAAVLGQLSALYFYAYAALQLPVGVIIDRYGARRALATALCLAGLGSVLLGLAAAAPQAYLGRLLVGGGSAVAFLATLKLAADWFPAERFAFLSGLTMVAGMAGAVLAQAPLAAVIERFGWRGAMVAAGVFAAVLALAAGALITPAGRGRGAGGDTLRAGAFRAVLTRPRTWIIAVHCGAAAGPIFAYAALWGVPHLEQRFGLERPAAAAVASLFLLGWAVGAPALGWLSDRLRRRRAPMAACAALNLAAWSTLLYLPGLGLAAALPLIVLIGLASGGAVIAYAAARDQAPPELAATASAVVNAVAVGSGAVLQPLVGLLLDASWAGAVRDGARVYGLDAFARAFSVIPASLALALALAWLAREPLARPGGADGGLSRGRGTRCPRGCTPRERDPRGPGSTGGSR